jgi:hypothetical protein
MSEETTEASTPIDVIPTSASPISKPTNKEEAKALFLSLRDRGIVNERFNIPLPSDIYGEWVVNDPIEINRFLAMGFEFGDQYAKQSAIHGTARIADVVFMTAPRFVKEAIDEVNRERFEAMHGAPGRRKNLKEERDLASKSELPIVNQSSQEAVDINAIKAALESTTQ